MAKAEWQTWIEQAEVLFDKKEFDEAAALAERALKVVPDYGPAHQVMGLVQSERAKPWEAIERLTKALSLQPDLVHSHNGIGRCYFLLGDLERAKHHFETALRIQADHSFAHFNRAMVLLKKGEYEQGWMEYEWRWKCGLVSRPSIPRPRWDGSPLYGRSILIHTEQGLGDVLQFIRFLPHLKRQGGRVVFACQKALHGLLRGHPYVDEWFPIDEPGTITFDVYCPLLSLPGLLGVNESDIPRGVPYIFPEDRKERWRARISNMPGFKVGIGWQGSPTFKGDLHRSIPLSYFAPLTKVPGVTLVSLQKGPGVEQIEANRDTVPVRAFPEIDQDAAFIDSASIIPLLDLVITSDSAVCHLAGALGKPVWVMLSVSSDWRFLLDRDDCPWYPSMRLFRQRSLGDWAGVFQDVADALRTEIARAKEAAELSRKKLGAIPEVPISAGELLDKISILEIKLERLTDKTQLANVRKELDLLYDVRREALAVSKEAEKLAAELRGVNEELWKIEDDIRLCERQGDFGERFIELARAVYQKNDRRSVIKRQINELLRSPIVEEKSYAGWRS